MAAPTPTFCLFRLDPVACIQEYLKDINAKITIPSLKVKIGGTSEQGLINVTHGISPYNETFSFTSRSNQETIFDTMNNKQFNTYRLDGKYQVIGPCKWCNLAYESGMGGIPVISTPEISPYTGNVIPSFGMVERVCDMRCALAIILSRSRGVTRHNISNNSETWIRVMHALSYPNAPKLEAAPLPDWLKENGGTYTREQYKSTRYVFVETKFYIMAPVKPVSQRVIL
jgi:hypothetical protein